MLPPECRDLGEARRKVGEAPREIRSISRSWWVQDFALNDGQVMVGGLEHSLSVRLMR